MATMEELQTTVVEGLGSHRHAVDGELGKGFGKGRGDSLYSDNFEKTSLPDCRKIKDAYSIYTFQTNE